MNEEDIQQLFNSQIFGCETSPRHLDLYGLGIRGHQDASRKGCQLRRQLVM